MRGFTILFTLLVAVSLSFSSALAAGIPEPWQLGFQESGSPVQEQLNIFHDLLLYIITSISIFVLLLLVFCCVRYNKWVNKNPSKTSHNTILEIIWTAVPVMILVVIAIPSFRVLYYMDKVQNPEMTIKVTGYQWYWGYSYPDHGDFYFDAYMIRDEDLKENQRRLLDTDKQVVLPVDTDIRILVTAADVIHSWAVPSLGIKKDAIPGRLNETWVRIEEKGTYYGQCSEICGTGHAFMPIKIQAVSKEEFEQWVADAQEEYAGRQNNMPEPVQTAAVR